MSAAGGGGGGGSGAVVLELNNAWSNLEQAGRAYFDKQRELRRTSIIPAWERALKRKRQSPLEKGHATCKSIYATLQDFDRFLKHARTREQQNIQDMIIASSAAAIYGPCFEANRLAIMRKNRWKSDDLTPWGMCFHRSEYSSYGLTRCSRGDHAPSVRQDDSHGPDSFKLPPQHPESQHHR